MKETTVASLREGAHAPAQRGRPKGSGGSSPELGQGASSTAKRVAAAILEVLAGARTPTEAAQALGVSVTRYYLLEVRALHGMLVACEPRTPSRGPSPQSALATLRRECEQLWRECSRQQALVRAAQRSLGLAPPAPPQRGPEPNGKKRRRRRATARGLRAAAQPDQPDQQAIATAATAPSVNT